QLLSLESEMRTICEDEDEAFMKLVQALSDLRTFEMAKERMDNGNDEDNDEEGQVIGGAQWQVRPAYIEFSRETWRRSPTIFTEYEQLVNDEMFLRSGNAWCGRE